MGWRDVQDALAWLTYDRLYEAGLWAYSSTDVLRILEGVEPKDASEEDVKKYENMLVALDNVALWAVVPAPVGKQTAIPLMCVACKEPFKKGDIVTGSIGYIATKSISAMAVLYGPFAGDDTELVVEDSWTVDGDWESKDAKVSDFDDWPEELSHQVCPRGD